ncbi:MAG: rhomboid family intramembrane serine protease [Thermodesulfobacteriota bacterium]|nr:rhomboid family intramembrane serine protease [Bryobacteraceae bacterium]
MGPVDLGDNVEDRMGPVRFLMFYLFCGVIANVVDYATNLHSTLMTPRRSCARSS